MTYAASGVDYGALDPAKLLGQLYGSQTVGGPKWLGVEPQEHRRGESAYILKLPHGHLAHVEEGLGTKILMADILYRLTGANGGYHCVSLDTIAMIVNDMITLGVPPVSLQMHLGVGSGEWLKDKTRIEALMQGWRDGCLDSGVVWTGGETPALKDIINPDSAVLAGSAVGFLPDPYLPFEEEICEGDKIIAIASSGVHANGISLVRQIGANLPEQEMIELYNEALVPTLIYVRLINEMIRRHIRPSYAIHVTGHGWRKFMRANSAFTYRITTLLPVQPIFGKIQSLGNVQDREMWGNYNMGTGFGLIVRPYDVASVLAAAKDSGFIAEEIGLVEAGPKRVIIEPANVTFEGESMALR